MRYIIPHIALLFLLAACTSPPVKLSSVEQKQVYNNTQSDLRFLTTWEMHGRMNIQHKGRSDTASIVWLQERTGYGIKLTGPLGQGAVYLLGDKSGVTYKDSEGNTDAAPTPESLLQSHTGYVLPISNLMYWVIGRPVPGMPLELTLNPQGYAIEMQQDEWHIVYQYYRPYGEYTLPTRILLEHPEFRINLSIHDWYIP